MTGKILSVCAHSDYCKASPEPRDVLLTVSVPAPTVPFLQKVLFLIENNSVQKDAPRNSFNNRYMIATNLKDIFTFYSLFFSSV